MMLAPAARLAGRVTALVAALGVAVAAGFAAQAWWRLPDLDAWHRIALEREFRRDAADAPATFPAYLEAEARLFDELKRRLYDDPGAAGTVPYGRYTPGSPVARLALDGAGNRSAELRADDPRGAVLLLHGLSDAPYSLHAVGSVLRQRGFHVVTLRLPGHGTAPGELTRVEWEDWDAAVAIAARHTAALAGPGRPFYIAGYSTGAALALMHALKALDDAALPMPRRLFLFSAAIGLTPFTAATEIAAAFAFVPGLGKARWLDVLPEYDPYKYNSFPVNAARQIWRLTHALDARLQAAATSGALEGMPTVTTFQSLVDATVRAADVLRRLYLRLPARGHELVVFDVNRQAFLAGLLAPGPQRDFDALAAAPALPFRLAVVGNRSPAEREVVEWVREAGSRDSVPLALGLSWPDDVLSLGHLAVPMPFDDPVYGIAPGPGGDAGAFTLGGAAPRGEGGALVVPLGTLARLRSNPFFAVIVNRLDAAVRADRR